MPAALSDRSTALASLADPHAPRVMSPTGLRRWLEPRGLSWQLSTATEALGEWHRMGLVEKVRRGVYLNLRAAPRPTVDEAAPLLRQGAVISLQRVLGQAGVLNNPTDWVTSVLPMGQSRAVGKIVTDRHTFVFVGMRDDLVPTTDQAWADDAYQPYAPVRTATPEKALLDWLYLAQVSPLWRMPPRQDIDLEELDSDRLDRLAQAMGLEAPLHAFRVGKPAPQQRPRRHRP